MRSLDKILQLFERERVDAECFHGVNGYGYGDVGREKFDRIIASLMGTEAALVRLQFFSGTHAISTALFSAVRPGDEILGVSGAPYDTLEEVLGLRPNIQTNSIAGSLKDYGVGYREIPLEDHPLRETEARFDLRRIREVLEGPDRGKLRLLHVQRSCGYQWRPSIRLQEIERLAEYLRSAFPDPSERPVLFVDNCYGELVEDREPGHVGADLMAGSLIKNLGGTLAPAGGYVAGRADLVARCAVRLSAPGVEGGATFNMYRLLFQGLSQAPGVVGESLKGAMLLAHVLGSRFPCNPPPLAPRTDIIQAVQLGRRERLLAFCREVQRLSPVGSFIRPEAGKTAGYGDEVVFADGTFTEGSTLELSADGPLRAPFVAYCQGGVHHTHWALILQRLLATQEFWGD
eukprot:gene38663-47003_t